GLKERDRHPNQEHTDCDDGDNGSDAAQGDENPRQNLRDPNAPAGLALTARQACKGFPWFHEAFSEKKGRAERRGRSAPLVGRAGWASKRWSGVATSQARSLCGPARSAPRRWA